MEKFTPYCYALVAAVAAMPSAALAQEAKTQIVKPADKTVNFRGHKVPLIAKMSKKVAAQPSTSARTKAPRKQWGGATSSEETLTEDFNKFAKGSADEPDSEALCDEYGYFGGPVQWDIDPQYTEEPGWCGSWVFQAGGYAYLNDPFGYIGALLNSPLGDYSGNITITLRVKNYGKSSTLLNVSLLKNGYNNPTYAVTDEPGQQTSTSVNLYPNTGWKTITLKVHNISSDNDGFLQLLAYGQCLIDYVHITREDNFIAAPKILPETGFTDNSFTANRQKVAMASNYWLRLYQRTETGTEDRSWTADFEGSIPEEFSTNAKTVEGIGENQTSGLAIADGDTLTTPYNFSIYKDMKYWMKVEGATEEELQNNETKINIDVLTLNGWKGYGEYSAMYWTEEGSVSLNESSYGDFAGKYYGVRFSTENMPRGAFLALDNINIEAGKDAQLDAIGDNYLYDITENTSYTFTEGIEADKDYIYAVQSHYGKLASDIKLHSTFGVAAPKAKPATDIDSRGSYTANWEPSVKATGYRADNYGLHTASEDGLYDVIDEDFSLINDNVTDNTTPDDPEEVGNNKYQNIDSYTKLPGWTARNMALSQGWFGAVNDDYTSGSVKTPAMYLDNDDSFQLTLKAEGTPDSYLQIITPTQTYYVQFDEEGEIDDTFTVPERSKAMTLRFTADATFMLDYVKVSQNLKAGDNVYVQLGSTTVDGKENTSAAFGSLYDYDFDKFAYAVTALRTDGTNSTVSDPSDYVTVDLENGSSSVTAINNAETNETVATVVARYSLDGRRASTPQHGVNILKMSDGTVKKVIVK